MDQAPQVVSWLKGGGANNCRGLRERLALWNNCMPKLTNTKDGTNHETSGSRTHIQRNTIVLSCPSSSQT